jgi:hypothetical protein
MIEGRCPNCGRLYYGWVLLQQRHQSCTKCGVGLLITEDGKKTIQGYSPFTAEEYMTLSPGTRPAPKELKDNIVKE